MKKVSLICALLIIVLLAAPALAYAQEGPKTPPRRDNMQLYQGDGWWFFYPQNAVLEQTAPDSLKIVGPMIEYRHMTQEAIYQEPAYSMDVVIYPNPERVFPEVFAQNLYFTEYQQIAGQGPYTGPVIEGADGSLSFDPNRISAPIISNLPTFVVEGFGGIAPIYHVYMGGGDPIVAFIYWEHFPANVPVALMQADIYNMIINTFERAE